jgi:DNA-binding phage protein
MNGKIVLWEEGLLQDLKDPDFAKGYTDACLAEGVSLQVALGKVIKAQGFSDVARKAHMAVPNVIRAVRPSSNPTVETMRILLRSAGLDFSVQSKKTKEAKKLGLK